MEALAILHHCHQPLSFSANYNCPSLRRFISSHFLSPPAPPLYPSIRASSDSSRPNIQNPQTPLNQFLDPFPRITSFAFLTAASTLLVIGFCRNALVAKPITPSPMSIIEESMVEEGEIEELVWRNCKPFHVCSMRFLKLKVRIPVVHDFTKMRPDDQAWQALKSQVYSCSKELDLVEIGFEEILEKDPYRKKSYHDRILEYLKLVDECKVLLKSIKLAMDRCERENGDMKYYLRFFNVLVDRIKFLEKDMLDALKYFQELEQN